MERRFLKSILTIVGLCLIVSINGCKEDTIINSSIAPGNNILGTTLVPDTFTIITKTSFFDTLVTSNKISGEPFYHAAGSFFDPYFGKTTAGIYFQVALPEDGFTFAPDGVNYTIDSAVLVMRYSGNGFGDTTNPGTQKFVVHEVTENMSIDATYYSNQRLNISSNTIGEADIDFKKVFKELPMVGDTLTDFRHIRIPLTRDFINKVNDQIGQPTFDNDANFLDYFKGFYVGPADTTLKGNVLPYFNLEGSADYARTAIVFYLREDGSSETKAVFFNYDRNKTANYNWINRNYTNSRASYWLSRLKSNPNQSDDTILVQNGPGATLDIRIPYISNLPDAPILKAELVIKKVSTGNAADSLTEPFRLVPFGVNDDGSLYIIRDYLTSSTQAAEAFVYGFKSVEKDNSGASIITYRINIPREVQKAISEDRNGLHLRIGGSTTFPGAYRLVAGGSNGSYKVQFNVLYSKPD